MLVKTEITDLRDFEAWCGAVDTAKCICDAGEGEHFISELGAIYPDGMTAVELNDLLWFDDDWCFNLVGLSEAGKTEEEYE